MKKFVNAAIALLFSASVGLAQSYPLPTYRDVTLSDTIGTGAVSRTVNSVINNLGRTPEQYGAVCDGTTDDSTALQKWLAALVVQQAGTSKSVRGWVSKTCYSSTALSTANVGLYLDGPGRLIFASGVSGLTVDNSAWSRAIPVEIHNIGIITNGVATGTGLTIKGSAVYTNLVRTAVVDNVRISGADTAKGWLRGFDGRYILNGVIDKLYVAGIASFAGSVTGCGVYLGGGSNIVNITNANMDWLDTGVCVNTDADGTTNEGVRLIDSTIRAARWGMITRGLGNYHVVQGGHFDVVKGAADIGQASVVGSDFSQVSGAFILRSAADTWSGYNFVGIKVNANYPTIQRNTIWLDGSTNGGIVRQANAVGISVGDASDTTKTIRGTISGNNIAGPNTNIQLLAQTKYTTVTGNQGDAFGNTSGVNVTNGGNLTNTVRNNPYVNSSAVYTVNQASDLSLPYADVYITSTLANATGDNTAVGFGGSVTALKNIGSALNTTTMTLTAPVPGVYEFTGFLNLSGVSTANFGLLRYVFSAAGDKDLAFYAYGGGAQFTFTQYMNAGETVFPILFVSGGTKVVSVTGGANKSKLTFRLVRPD